jgi:predicted RNA methylase
MVDEFGERSVLDIGCGTGTFASLLASRGRSGVVSEGLVAAWLVVQQAVRVGGRAEGSTQRMRWFGSQAL